MRKLLLNNTAIFTLVLLFPGLINAQNACNDMDYCESFGPQDNTIQINSLTINDFVNESGNDTGYGDFTGSTATTLSPGQEYELNLEITNSGFTNEEIVRVWIDLNMDGEFTEDEMLVDESGVGETLLVNFEIPSDATLGVTRMRVSLKSAILFFGSAPEPCEDFGSGEVEDYCVEIQEFGVGVEEISKSNVRVFPNPAQDQLTFQVESNLAAAVRVFEVSGRLVRNETLFNTQLNMNVSDLNNGIYIYQIVNESGEVLYTDKFVVSK